MAARGTRAVWAGVVALVFAAAGPAAAKPVEAKGTIEAATVYRGQALVTRRVEADVPAGSVELVVTDLPAQIVSDSLYAGAEGKVQIRAVRFRTRAVEQEPRPEVRDLDRQIEEAQRSIRQTQSQVELLRQKRAYLDSLEKFTAAQTSAEMAKGTMKVEAITGLTEFLFARREELSKATLDIAEKTRALQETLSLLQRRRAELTRATSRTAREAVLFLDAPAAGKLTVRLHYLVTGASWSPTYNLRSGRDGDRVQLEYNALVQQMSGEDWEKVRLTLSTASPKMVSEAPILTPLWVTLQAGAPRAPSEGPDLYGGQRAALGSLNKALEGRGGQAGRPGGLDRDWDINTWANRLQYLDLVGRRDALLAGQEVGSSSEVLSVNYTLTGAISIPSRADQQMIQIASLQLAGTFYYLATPMLSPFVYQHADIVNTSDVALLAGPVGAYLDGEFKGRGQIPMVAKGQRFTVGFGVDSQLRTGRELADKTDRVQGGNRMLGFKYRLLIDNYKDQPVKVRLLDRLPDPRGADIEVTLGDMSDKLSEDKLYLRTIRKMGILRWEVDVPAKSSGAKSRSVEYAFTMEFERTKHVGEPSATQVERQKMEFRQQLEMMQRAK